MSLNKKINSTIKSHGKVIENYFFMTILQIINSAFGLLIYPYLIRVLGSEQYGLYVFGMTITNYFVSIVSYGFNFPAVKIISTNKADKNLQSSVFSLIFTSKLYLTLISTLVFLLILFLSDKLYANKFIFIVCFSQVLGELLTPTWYFQGTQKMGILTIIQIITRVLSLPLIFSLVKNSNDLLTYSMISSSVVVIIGIAINAYLILKEKLTLQIKKFKYLKKFFKEGFPFFLSTAVGTLKQETATLAIGLFFGMREVALFDLANKIVLIPRTLTNAINGALFPQVIENLTPKKIRKIIRYEVWLGAIISIFIALVGYWLVLLLGGKDMVESYPISVILSTTIFVWLVVGSFISFVFVPANKYFYVTENQLVALLSFIMFSAIGLFFYKNILILAIALSLSGFCEVIYCIYKTKEKKLL